jgi:small subunit ribosomal protein S17
MKEKNNKMSDYKRKSVIGSVISDKMDKTIRVIVRSKKKHEQYKKYVPTKVVYYAHDEKNSAKEGDTVKISFVRPISKTKRWKLEEILTVAD